MGAKPILTAIYVPIVKEIKRQFPKLKSLVQIQVGIPFWSELEIRSTRFTGNDSSLPETRGAYPRDSFLPLSSMIRIHPSQGCEPSESLGRGANLRKSPSAQLVFGRTHELRTSSFM
jgi:hypothetical protein